MKKGIVKEYTPLKGFDFIIGEIKIILFMLVV